MAGAHMPYWVWGFRLGRNICRASRRFSILGKNRSAISLSAPQGMCSRFRAAGRAARPRPLGGLGGVFAPEQERDALARYLARPITLCVGDEYREHTDPSLARSRAARRQGPDRLTRAAKTFDPAAVAALRRGLPFNWAFEVVPGFGHVANEMLEPRIAAPIMPPAN